MGWRWWWQKHKLILQHTFASTHRPTPSPCTVKVLLRNNFCGLRQQRLNHVFWCYVTVIAIMFALCLFAVDLFRALFLSYYWMYNLNSMVHLAALKPVEVTRYLIKMFLEPLSTCLLSVCSEVLWKFFFNATIIAGVFSLFCF